MKIYHGSTFIVKEPNIEVLNFRTDFGKGFYTTTDYEQSKNFVRIKITRLQKKNIMIKAGYINIYEYTENKDLRILNFQEATEEWLDFVFSNRASKSLQHTYDIVKGPVADDKLFGTLQLYEEGEYTKEEALRRLETYKLVDQISFHTPNALQCIKYIKTEEVLF